MSRPIFRFDQLEQLRSAVRDERQAALQEAYASEHEMAERLAAIEREIASAQQHNGQRSASGPLQVDDLIARHNYVAQRRTQLATVSQRHQELLAELEKRRAALVDASKDTKILEKLRKQQLLRHRRQQTRQDVRRADQIAQRRATPARPI